MSEEFDLEELPGNPRMCESFEEFSTRQRDLIGQTEWPPGTEFECKGCGECCKWFFIVLETDEELIEKLQGHAPDPHGFWHLKEGRIEVRMPHFYFIVPCPPTQEEYMTVPGRTWGYWVLKKSGKVVLYNPVPCIHLSVEKTCSIYEDRPRVCRMYFCRRWPVTP